MEEARGETFTWNELKENFINDFKFSSWDELLVEARKQIKKFLQLIDNKITTEDQLSQQNSTCNHTRSTKTRHSTRLQLKR